MEETVPLPFKPFHAHSYRYTEIERMLYITGHPAHSMFEAQRAPDSDIDLEHMVGRQAETIMQNEVNISRLVNQVNSLQYQLFCLEKSILGDLAVQTKDVLAPNTASSNLKYPF